MGPASRVESGLKSQASNPSTMIFTANIYKASSLPRAVQALDLTDSSQHPLEEGTMIVPIFTDEETEAHKVTQVPQE